MTCDVSVKNVYIDTFFGGLEAKSRCNSLDYTIEYLNPPPL